VDDLEARAVEPFDLLQIPRQPAGDRDMRVREGRDRPVAERKARVLAELVEAVFRRHAHRNSRQRAGELSVHVGVHEMRVQDPRPLAREVRAEPQEGNRIDVRRK
jgi:hypothetical protein